jgi:CheY-like chemotaxis protein
MSVNCNTILLVEDNPDDIALFKRALHKMALDYPLQVVGDGEAAIAYLSGEGHYANRNNHPLPRLVLLDLKLPRKSGHEVLEWLRADPALRRLPVVVLTTSREISDINRAYDQCVNSYLVKPFSFDGLTDMVRTLYSYWMQMNETAECRH